MIASDGVENVVNTRTLGLCFDDGFKILVVSVDGPSTVLLDDVMLAFGRGCPNALNARPLAQLQGRCSHPAGATVHEHLVLRAEVAKMMQHVMGRHVGDRRRGRCLKRNIVGKGNHAVNRGEDETGLAAVSHGSHHLLPNFEASDALTKRINHAADLVAWRERVRRTRLVEPEPHEEVGEIDACVGHLDANFPFPRRRGLHGFGGDGRNTAGFLDDDPDTAAHSATLHVPFDCITDPSASSAMRWDKVWSTAKPGWASGVSA